MFRFNSILALVVVIGIPLLILASNLLGMTLSGEVIGTFTGGWLLVIQFFFRKAEPKV